MNEKNNPGDELINVIRKYAVTEWQRFDRRFIHKLVNPTDILCNETYIYDGIRIPPSTNFRLKNENTPIDFISVVEDGIHTFNGNLEWTLSGFRKSNGQYNWGVMPAIAINKDIKEKASTESISVKLYLEKYHPEYGTLAFDDLPKLAKHIDKCLSEHFKPIDYSEI